jgi:hypothetical protein
MVCKKVKNSSTSLLSIVNIMLITMGLFFTSFLYMKTQTDNAGIVIDTKYNDTFTRLTEAQDDIDVNVHAIQLNLENVSEADSTYQVAVNGFKTLGNTLKLTLSFVSSAVDTVSAIIIPLDVIPNNIKSLIFIGLIVVVIFVVLAVLKGDDKLVR